MFIGQFEHSIDSKNRIIVPSKFRENARIIEKNENPIFIVTRGFEQALFMFTRTHWEEFSRVVKNFPMTNEDARIFIRFFFAGATEQEIDRQGRLTLPGHLIQFAGIERDVIIIGAMDRIEIWAKEKWDAYFNTKLQNIEEVSEKLTRYKSE